MLIFRRTAVITGARHRPNRLQHHRRAYWPLAVLCALLMSAGLSSVVFAETVLRQEKIERSVSFLFDVLDSGVIEGELVNATTQRVSDVEVLVRYSWIWNSGSGEVSDDPSWSTKYTFPVELDPGESSPLSIPPLRPLGERTDGIFRITANVIGYTRYRWANEAKPQGD